MASAAKTDKKVASEHTLPETGQHQRFTGGDHITLLRGSELARV